MGSGGAEVISDERIDELIDKVENEILCPITLVEALELSLAKWHPKRGQKRGVGLCGLCSYDRHCGKDSCVMCPLKIEGIGGCDGEDHPYQKWEDARYNDPTFPDAECIDEKAEVVYQMILSAYEAKVKK